MEDSDFWELLSSHLNGSDEAEIKSRLASLLNVESEQVTVTDLIEALVCHFDANCTQHASSSREHVVLKNAINFMETFLLPVILFLGISGNTISILAFVLSDLRTIIPVFFLVAIAVVDVGFLVSLLLVWLEKYHKGFHTSEGLCQLTIYVSYVCTYLSVWYLAALSLERYLVVCVYSCKRQFYTSTTAKATLYSLGLTAGVIYLYLTWTSGVIHGYGGQVCSPLPQFASVLATVAKVETIVGLMLPYVLICTLSILLVYGILKQSKSIGQGPVQCDPLDNNISRISRGRQLYQLRVTRLSLVLSFISIILSVPCHALRLRAMFLSSSARALLKFSENEFLWQELLQYCFYTKASINFFVYSLVARGFRKAVKSLLVRMKFNHLPCFSGFTQRLSTETRLEMERYGSVQDFSSVASTEI